LLKAKGVLNHTADDELDESGRNTDLQNKAPYSSNQSFGGFQTGNGYHVPVNPAAIMKAKGVLNKADDNEVPQIKLVDKRRSLPAGRFGLCPTNSTPKGRPLQRRGFIRHKVDPSRVTGESSYLPESGLNLNPPAPAKTAKRVYPRNAAWKPPSAAISSAAISSAANSFAANSSTGSLLTDEERRMIESDFDSIAEEFLNDDWDLESASLNSTKANTSALDAAQAKSAPAPETPSGAGETNQ